MDAVENVDGGGNKNGFFRLCFKASRKRGKQQLYLVSIISTSLCPK